MPRASVCCCAHVTDNDQQAAESKIALLYKSSWLCVCEHAHTHTCRLSLLPTRCGITSSVRMCAHARTQCNASATPNMANIVCTHMHTCICASRSASVGLWVIQESTHAQMHARAHTRVWFLWSTQPVHLELRTCAGTRVQRELFLVCHTASDMRTTTCLPASQTRVRPCSVRACNANKMHISYVYHCLQRGTFSVWG